MILEDFLIETEEMSIFHLYFDEKKLHIFDSIKQKNKNFTSLNLNESTKIISKADFFFIEIGETTKDKLKTLLTILTRSKPIATYIFADDVENTLLLKFALHFGIADVFPLEHNNNLLASIFTKSPNKLDEKIEIYKRMNMGKKIDQFFPLFIFKEQSLVYANSKALTLYGINNLHDIEEKLNLDEELFNVLQTDQDAQGIIVIENASQEKLPYLCLLKHIPHSSEKLLTLINYEPEDEKNCSSILNRFDFVDRLKDRLAQQSMTNTNISLIFLNISNLEKLRKTFKGLTIHESLKKFLTRILYFKEEHQEVVQWSPELYMILCENIDFERTCEQARYMQQELINTTSHDKITPVIITSALMIENNDLNEVLNYIEKIGAKSMTPQDVKKIKFYEIDYLENVIEENEQITYLMRNCITNKIPIRLLNIYKGLCINTNSTILKINDDTYHLFCENLQGYAMQLEGSTVLQAPNFYKDIKAEVSLVDIKKSCVILKNLSFMNNSANNRQHTRVQTDIRTPILIRYEKSSMQGEILDISVNSIAMKTNKLFKEDIKNKIIRLNFSLPNEKAENGYIIMDVAAKVTYVGEVGDYVKIVVMIENLPKPYDEYLLQYMYSRQKELILEIRRATRTYN